MKIIKTIISGEFLFALFLFAGYFKSIFTFIPIDLTFFLLVVTFIIAMKRLRDGKQVFIKPVLLWLAFIILALLSLLYTHPSALSSGVAFEKAIRLSTISTWCFVAPFLLFNGRDSIKRFIIAIISLGIIMGLTSLTTGQNEAGFVEVFGSNYQALSRISGSTAIILLGIYLFSKNKLSVRLLSLITGIALLIPMLVSGGRLTAVIFLIIALGIFPLLFFEFNFKKGTLKIYKRVYAYVVTAGLISLSVYMAIRSGWLDTFLFRVGVLFDEVGSGSSVAGRSERMDVAVDMISSNLLLGQGLGSFGFHFLQGLLDDTPHHIFLEIWSEMGIVPLTIFLYLFFVAAINAYKVWTIKKNDWVYASLFLVSSFWIISALISSGLTSGKILFAFMAVAIVSYHVLTSEEKVDEQKKKKTYNYQTSP